MTRLDLYWMTDKEWFEVDEGFQISLTSKAPPEAVKSFKNYKKQLKKKKHVL